MKADPIISILPKVISVTIELSVYKYFLLNPPLTIQKINMIELKKAEQKKYSTICMIIDLRVENYLLFRNCGINHSSAIEGNISFILKTAGCGNFKYVFVS